MFVKFFDSSYSLLSIETSNNVFFVVGNLNYKFNVFKLLLLPLVVSVTYELNRWIGRHDNWFTRILSAPGMWMQKFTTNEPDDSMIEVGIASLQAVLPKEEGVDRW